jgi:pimeloyl-ACP methyl ester carboxylesterase
MAGDAVALLKHFGGGPALVVGHSMGGRNAAFLAAAHPKLVRALAILDMGTAGSATMSQRLPEELPGSDGLTADWPLPFPTRQAARDFLATKMATAVAVEYFSESLYQTAAGWDFRFSRRAMAAVGEYWRNWDHEAGLLRCPVLYLRAASSWCLSLADAERFRSLVPACEYHEISGSDHNIHLDNPGEFYPIFEEFIVRIPEFTKKPILL